MSVAKPQAGEPPVDLDRERRLGRLAGVAGILSLVAFFGALIANAIASPAGGGALGGTPQEGDETGLDELLVDFDADLGTQAIGLGLKVASLLALIAVLLFFYDATRRRQPGLSRGVGVFAVIGPVLFGAAATVTFFALADAAQAFVAAGAPSTEAAEDILGDSTFYRVGGVFEIATGVALGAAVGWAAYSAMQVGLLTRFLGIFGIAAGVATVLLGSTGQALLFGWVGSVALIALGYWPGGRPKAWKTGRAEVWEDWTG